MIPKNHQSFIDSAVTTLKEDSRIIGVAAAGSYLTCEMDEYSDIDLIIVIDADCYKSAMNGRYETAEKLGMLLSAFTGEHVGEPRLLICLYGPELLHVDLRFVSINDIAKRIEEPHIFWQRNNCITEALKSDIAQFPIPSLQWMEDRFWVWVHYGATKIGRGEIFEAIDFLSSLRQMVLGPLILMKSEKRPSGVRKIEFYSPEYIDLLKETIPTYSSESCIESTKAVIRLYLELREHFISREFVKREEAEKYSMDYLIEISSKG